jgi:hypothetical protein
MTSISPIIPPAIEGCTRSFVTSTATTINASAPSRSRHGARLKNNHHSTRSNPHASAPITPTVAASGVKSGATKRSSHCTATITTPGQSRSGWEAGVSSAGARAEFMGQRLSLFSLSFVRETGS